MLPKLIKARHRENHTLFLEFSDGTRGNVDLEPELTGEIFLPLRKMGYFIKFRINPDFHTLSWPNGADFAPEYLLRRLRAGKRNADFHGKAERKTLSAS